MPHRGEEHNVSQPLAFFPSLFPDSPPGTQAPAFRASASTTQSPSSTSTQLTLAQIQEAIATGMSLQDASILLLQHGISGNAATAFFQGAQQQGGITAPGDQFTFTPGTTPTDPSLVTPIFTPQQENEQLLSGSPEGRFTLFNAFLNQQNPGLNPIFGNAITNRTLGPQSAAFQLDSVLRNFNAGQFLDSGGPAAAPENFSSFLGNNFGGGIPNFGGQLGQLATAFGGENTVAQETALDRLRPGDAGTQNLAQSLISSIIGSRLAPSFRSGLSNRLTPLFSEFQTQNPGAGLFEAFLQGNLGTGFGGFGG